MDTYENYELDEAVRTQHAFPVLFLVAKILFISMVGVVAYAAYTGDGVLVAGSFVALLCLGTVLAAFHNRTDVLCSRCGLKMEHVLVDVNKKDLGLLGRLTLDPEFADLEAVIIADNAGRTKYRLMNHLAVCDKCRTFLAVDKHVQILADKNGRPVRTALSPSARCRFRIKGRDEETRERQTKT